MYNFIKLTKIAMQRNKILSLIAVLTGGLVCFVFILFFNANSNENSSDDSISKINIGIIDYDNSVLSKDLCDYLSDDLNMNLVDNKSYDEMSSLLINTDISAIIEIPKSFYEKAIRNDLEKLTLTTLTDYENIAFLQVYIDNYMSSISVISQSCKADQSLFDEILTKSSKNKVKLTSEKAIKSKKLDDVAQSTFVITMGFCLMIIMCGGMYIGYVIIDDKHNKTYERMQITNLKPLEYLAGIGINGFLLCMIICLFPLGYIFLKGYNIGISYGLVLLMCALFSLFVVGISLTLAITLNSKISVSTILLGSASIMGIIGGAYFPVGDYLGKIRILSYLTPHYWFMDILYQYQDNDSINIIPNLYILALFALLMFLIGAMIYSRRKK